MIGQQSQDAGGIVEDVFVDTFDNGDMTVIAFQINKPVEVMGRKTKQFGFALNDKQVERLCNQLNATRATQLITIPGRGT